MTKRGPTSPAFEAFYRRNQDRLTRHLRRRLPSAAEVDEQFASTMEIAWRRFGSVPNEGEFGWLCAIAGYVRLNAARSQRRRLLGFERFRALLPRERLVSSLDSSHLLHHQREVLIEALAALSERDQEVLLLAVWDGLGPSELAMALETSATAARQRLSRARRRLRDHYNALAFETEVEDRASSNH